MGLSDHWDAPARSVLKMMQRSKRSRVPAHTGVIDSVTLYLCRQGRRWVVIMESPSVSGALPLGRSGHDSTDAQCELLATARRACPTATLMSTDGALTSADYEWRVEVRGVVTRPGDLGLALHRELSAESGRGRQRPTPACRGPLPLGHGPRVLGPAPHLLTSGLAVPKGPGPPSTGAVQVRLDRVQRR